MLGQTQIIPVHSVLPFDLRTRLQNVLVKGLTLLGLNSSESEEWCMMRGELPLRRLLCEGVKLIESGHHGSGQPDETSWREIS
jgi:hypothetical protein